MEYLNKIICGDLFETLPDMPESVINLCFTSPPYALQRSKYYPSIGIETYAEFTLKWFNLVSRTLVSDGSIILNIREHEKNGCQDLYVLRTILHLCDNGWKLNGRFVWHKPTAAPLGSKKRLRRAFEDLYWFSKVDKPYVNAKGLGRKGDVGFTNKRYFEMGLCCEHKEAIPDIIVRSTDVFSVGVSKNKKGNPHPAQFPEELASQLIQIFCPIGGCVLDPFSGSGTTAASAKRLGRSYCGIEIDKSYVDYSLGRLGQETL
jgi:DNA modification methylase